MEILLVVFAGLWGLVLGLRLVKKLSLQHVIVELDSEVVVNMVKKGSSNCLFLKPLLEEATVLLAENNVFLSIRHIIREANRSVNLMATLGRDGSFYCTRMFDPHCCLFPFS